MGPRQPSRGRPAPLCDPDCARGKTVRAVAAFRGPSVPAGLGRPGDLWAQLSRHLLLAQTAWPGREPPRSGPWGREDKATPAPSGHGSRSATFKGVSLPPTPSRVLCPLHRHPALASQRPLEALTQQAPVPRCGRRAPLLLPGASCPGVTCSKGSEVRQGKAPPNRASFPCVCTSFLPPLPSPCVLALHALSGPQAKLPDSWRDPRFLGPGTVTPGRLPGRLRTTVCEPPPREPPEEQARDDGPHPGFQLPRGPTVGGS